jgi:hypothetical protein
MLSVVYLPPYWTRRTKHPASSIAYHPNRQWLLTSDLSRLIPTFGQCRRRTENSNPRISTTHQSPSRTYDTTPLDNPPPTFLPVFNWKPYHLTLRLHNANAACTGIFVYHKGRSHQTNTQVQPNYILGIIIAGTHNVFSKYHHHIHLGHTATPFGFSKELPLH